METNCNFHRHSPSRLPKLTFSPDMMSPLIPLQPLPTSHTILSNEPQLSQAQVASMRRKKNADAQAAFRARRANYISSLEETVISLEAVVLSLQDSCRESRNDADDLRQETNHLRAIIDVLQKDSKDREKQWRDFWIAKLQSLGLDDPHQLNDFPPHPPPQNLSSIQSATYSSRPPSFVGSDPLRFSTSQRFQSSSTGITAYSSDPNWVPASFSNTRTACIGDPHPSHPSSASDSPSSISPSIPYGSRFSLTAGEDGRNNADLVGVNMSNASYETSSLVTEYGSEDYPTSATTTTTRHSFSENERCVRPRRSYSGPHPRGSDFYGADISPTESDHLNSEDHSSANGSDLTHTRPRRHTSASILPHSPSLSPPPTRDRDLQERDAAISNTLAVIKAQAFGSLRRTRTRVKKPSDSASKVAMDLLSARGVGLGLQSPVSAGGTTSRLHMKRKSECLDDVEI